MRISTKTLTSVSTKSFFVAFVIAIGVIAFLVTGVGFRMSRLDANAAAKVGNQVITVRALSEQVQQLNSQAGGEIDDAKRLANTQSAMNQLIQEKVLIEEATRMGFSAHDSEVAEWIRRVPAFQNPKTKKFDKSLYDKFIKSGQMSELDLFSRGRESLSQEKLFSLLQIPPYLPKSLVEDQVKRDGQELTVEYLEIKPSDEVIKQQVEEDAKKYMEDKANEQALKDAYEAAKDEFKQKAGVHARTILISFKGAERAESNVTRTEDEAKKAAESALAKLASGTEFAKVSEELNDDARAKVAKGDLGWVDESSLDPESSKAVFALTADKKLSEVVKTPFGYRVFQWVESRAAVEKSLDDVKLELARRQVSPPIRMKLASEMETEIKAKLPEAERAGLDAVLKKHHLAWKKISKSVNANTRYIEEVGMAESLIGPLFKLTKVGDITPDPIEVMGKKLIFKLDAKKDGEAANEKKVTQTRRMNDNRYLQGFIPEAQRILMDVYGRNKEIVRNPDILAL